MTNQYAIDRRPRKFSEVYGHEQHLIDLKNRSKDGSFPQVMMFTGMSGTGKTTLSNIVSMTMNCQNPIKQKDGSYEPCGECSSCKDIIEEKYSRDVVYRNASKMGKDDVNDLEKTASSSSIFDDKRIIIIEEAQELSSKGAKGALLKLIEKPRKDVHFILLTMDEKQFHKSILDRAQVYRFKPFTSEQTLDFMSVFIEQIDPNEDLPDSIVDVCSLIADNSEGSLRKAVQDLERAIKSEAFTVELASDIFDYVSEDQAFTLLQKLLNQDSDFFESLPSDLLSFYNYTFAILMGVKQGSITGNFGNDFKKKRAMNLLKTGKVDRLLETYISIQESTANYNLDKIIRFNLMKFFTQHHVKRLREETPTERVLSKENPEPKKRRRQLVD